ncbi:D-amino-acid transaminase [Sedimenticola thiotaurini]|uniref:Aminodeoxychorismate lyase n=1 Tax=Sedimenticola thiotaurini TaxID=1543721 RepID=A0A0F7JTS3_9GAMM|nr:D-amino-acid transaminase [Sedimenticola thiotaurini]AKH19052.1 D-amino acid aminotransferase [Sedimenticola thiotaurini]
MSRIVYVNGAYLPEEEAKVSVFDRGFLFADGVYEVSSVLHGRLVDNAGHLARLHRSLAELEMAAPASDAEIEAIQKALIERNDVQQGLVYLQVTRGVADRDFAYPEGVQPTLVMFTQSKNLLQNPQAERGIRVITTEDIRWKRRDIKTVGLLAPSMAKMIAKRAGADDAWLVEAGKVTEGSSNNAYIVTRDGTLVTRQLGNEILAGITRKAVLELARTSDLKIQERPFTVPEALDAAEAFISSATTFVMPVVGIDGQPVGDGRPGPVSRRLRELYISMALQEIGE